MKIRILSYSLVIFLLIPGLGFSQILQPVKWSKAASPSAVKAGETIELLFKAKIQTNWYLYSSDFDPKLGPIVTSFAFTPHPSYVLEGGIVPQRPKKKYDDLWGGEYTYFVKEGTFMQKVKVLKADIQIKAVMSGQTCSEIDGKCIPLEEDFLFTAADIKVAPASIKEETVAEVKTDDPKSATVIENNADTAKAQSIEAQNDSLVQKEQPVVENTLNTAEKPATTPFGWEDVLYAFLAGLAAIFTPCVFPMIPLTVSFFSGEGKGTMHALFYGFSIILIYTLIGALLAPLLGSDAANLISTHWIPNLIFFTIFLVFALSFFGMFDIALPSNFVNAMDRKADMSGGFAGVFFMAFTLTLVSFSCTGPLVGSILVASAMGEVLRPIISMAAFGSAFALPFMVFALFPNLMKGMPKSGGWLNGVKVTLGFIELALAFKFLSMIDLVYHLGILDRDLNIAIWIAIASFMGLYYLGKLPLPHDSPIDKISVPRMLLALGCFTFVVYLIPGMFGAPLKALSGVLPPTTLHDFDLHKVIRENSSGGGMASTDDGAGVKRKYADIFEMPHGFYGYFNYEQGMAVAKKLGKPVMLDFTGHGCANCRKMEDNVWITPEVRRRLENDWVIIELYVDDPTLLPEKEWVITADKKIKKTIGAANMHLETERFQNNAQPLYVLLDHDGNKLVEAKGYETNVQSFTAFLDAGMEAYKRKGK